MILVSHRILYLPVPKAACTSVKMMLHELETGEAYVSTAGEGYMIHRIRPTEVFVKNPAGLGNDFYKFAVIRDPIKRFLSAYSNRVVHYRELSMEKAGASLVSLRLKPDPDLPTFIARYHDYAEASPSIWHHTRPMVDFLGKDLRYFDRIYRIDELDALVSDLSARAGKDLVLPREQTGGPKFSEADLSWSQLMKIRWLFRKDYRVFKRLL